jgi:hypothetical protein
MRVFSGLFLLLVGSCAEGRSARPGVDARRIDGGERSDGAVREDGGAFDAGPGFDSMTCDDTDTDGVCDAADRCAGGDDASDADSDGTPDFCDCGASPMSCGENATCSDGTAGVTCACDSGFTGDGITCVPVDCGPLGAPVNGMVSAPTTTFGAAASYTCSPGYMLVGDATRTCEASGMWSGVDPRCDPVDCGPLGAPANGAVSAPATTFGSVATYSCSSGYRLVGDASRTCTETAVWSGTEPRCDPSCPPPPATLNGTVSAPSTMPGALATYACNAGYRMTGGQYLRCQDGGSWIGAVPICRPLLSCGCAGSFHEGERVRAAVGAPSSAPGLAIGTSGTAIAGSAGTLPLLVQWDGWLSGHNGNCTFADCGTCVASGTSRWYVLCSDVATQRLTCACSGAYSPGDRVVALIDAPASATGVRAGMLGTVIAGSSGTLPLLVQWDAWASGHGGNCTFATCGSCTESGLSRWYVRCDEIGRAP